MGAKISVDSATLMNKGLELIEALHLFPVGVERLEVVVHPQSIVHSLVEYVDGSLLAQLGPPDMRVPIAYALAWPERMATPCQRLDLAASAGWTSRRRTWNASRRSRSPRRRWPRAARKPAILNAANEIAVASFLESRIGFPRYRRIGRRGARRYAPAAPASIDAVLEIDREARRVATELIGKFAH